MIPTRTELKLVNGFLVVVEPNTDDVGPPYLVSTTASSSPGLITGNISSATNEICLLDSSTTTEGVMEREGGTLLRSRYGCWSVRGWEDQFGWGTLGGGAQDESAKEGKGG